MKVFVTAASCLQITGWRRTCLSLTTRGLSWGTSWIGLCLLRSAGRCAVLGMESWGRGTRGRGVLNRGVRAAEQDGQVAPGSRGRRERQQASR
jgi:hypothetical protein